MRNGKIRLILTLCTLLFAAGWERQAWADVTITGVVSEIGAFYRAPTFGDMVRFKLTDANQTAQCAYPNAPSTNGYAIFGTTTFYREWYSMLLLSKKGATITCTMPNNTTNCIVNSCTLQ